MKFQFDAVFYYVSDLDRAIRFYTDILEMRLVSRDAVARFDVDGVLFELVPGKAGGEGNARLCLRVEDINVAGAELQSKAVQVSEVEVKSNGKLAFFRDPDGNEIALWEYATD